MDENPFRNVILYVRTNEVIAAKPAGTAGHMTARSPDAVVVPQYVDALGVREVVVLNEKVEDTPAAEVEFLSNDAL